MKIVIEQILALRQEGYSFRKIAKELDTTVGKVQYRYQKHLQEQENFHEEDGEIQFSPNLPTSYDRDEVTLLPQSPTVLHTFWDISVGLRQMIEHQCRSPWHELKKLIRVYDCTLINFNGHNANKYFDIEIPEMTNNWTITNLEPNRTYLVDFGVLTRQHTFISLLRSNAIDTPRSSDSQKGLHVKAVYEWKQGQSSEPKWLEHFSTYSYYETVK